MSTSKKKRVVVRAKKPNRRKDIITLEKIIDDIQKITATQQINDPTIKKILEKLKANSDQEKLDISELKKILDRHHVASRAVSEYLCYSAKGKSCQIKTSSINKLRCAVPPLGWPKRKPKNEGIENE